jgi:dGTPase
MNTKIEEQHLGYFAADPKNAEPDITENDEEERTKFHRDRDRIIYSRAFRRLKGKTQVFLAGYDDHVRNRLTHTLEVSQLATSIAVSLNLNLMLTEAIALGHDLGHTPFGHVGERTLDNIMNMETIDYENRGFKHNWQSIRVVEFLEIAYRKYPGLNLTDYTRWGILNHSSRKFKHRETEPPFYNSHHKLFSSKSSTLWSFEGCVVELADEIAQRHHDFEDGVIADLIDHKELLKLFKCTFNDFIDLNKEPYKKCAELLDNEKHRRYIVPLLTKYIIHFYVEKYTELMKKNILRLREIFYIEGSKDFSIKKDEIAAHVFGKEQQLFYNDLDFNDFRKKDEKFQVFLKDRVLNSYQVQQMDGRSEYIINKLFEAYLKNPQQLADSAIISFFAEYKRESISIQLNEETERAIIIGDMRNKLNEINERNKNNKSKDIKFEQCLKRTITDQIAGMTDEYATYQYEVIYGAREMKNW